MNRTSQFLAFLFLIPLEKASHFPIAEKYNNSKARRAKSPLALQAQLSDIISPASRGCSSKSHVPRADRPPAARARVLFSFLFRRWQACINPRTDGRESQQVAYKASGRRNTAKGNYHTCAMNFPLTLVFFSYSEIVFAWWPCLNKVGKQKKTKIVRENFQ